MNRQLEIITQIEEEGKIVDKIELVTEGAIQNKNGKWYIRYEETELTGLENTKTMIKIEDEQVLIQRKGQVKSNLNIALGKTTENFYQTAYGVFDIVTKGYDLVAEIDALGKGRIQIVYSISINQEPEKIHSLTIVSK